MSENVKDKKILAVKVFDQPSEEYDYDMEVEITESSPRNLKHYWLVDNDNDTKVAIWACGHDSSEIDEAQELEFISKNIDKVIHAYAEVLEAAANVIYAMPEEDF